jgi:hypothetical protein
VADIARLAPALAENLRGLAELLEARAAYASALDDQRVRLMALRERVQQTLGPSILAVADAVGGTGTPTRACSDGRRSPRAPCWRRSGWWARPSASC